MQLRTWYLSWMNGWMDRCVYVPTCSSGVWEVDINVGGSAIFTSIFFIWSVSTGVVNYSIYSLPSEI